MLVTSSSSLWQRLRNSRDILTLAGEKWVIVRGNDFSFAVWKLSWVSLRHSSTRPYCCDNLSSLERTGSIIIVRIIWVSNFVFSVLGVKRMLAQTKTATCKRKITSWQINRRRRKPCSSILSTFTLLRRVAIHSNATNCPWSSMVSNVIWWYKSRYLLHCSYWKSHSSWVFSVFASTYC